jgi:hypothetical protein
LASIRERIENQEKSRKKHKLLNTLLKVSSKKSAKTLQQSQSLPAILPPSLSLSQKLQGQGAAAKKGKAHCHAAKEPEQESLKNILVVLSDKSSETDEEKE